MSINEKPHIHETVICVNAFVKKGDKYLMIKRSPKKEFCPNIIHPFGGKIDKDENPYIAIKREIFEETGFKIKNIRQEAVVLEILPHEETGCNWLVFYFTTDWESGELNVNEEGEAVWMTKEEILAEENVFPSFKEVVNNILNPNDGVVFTTFEYDDKLQIKQDTKKIDVCTV